MSKADENTGPTEEQVTKANEAELAKWEGDFPEEDLTIPYKREDDAEEKPKATEPPKDDDTTTAPTEEDTETVAYTDPTPLVTVQDPGEYTPADYSFEVTLKDGKTKKITSSEQADELAEDPENFETPKQLLDFIRRSQKMENQLDKDKATYDDTKKKFDEQVASESERMESINSMAAEFDYLIGKGLVPKVAPEFINADWQDPEVAKQPGVKEQSEILSYMVKENQARSKAKVKQLTSVVDAFNAWQLDTERKQVAEDSKAAGQARKAASARISSGSPAQQGTFVPKGIAVGKVMQRRGAAVWDD